MPTSVMPKGVEHLTAHEGRCAICKVMPTSVMPKGVEHLSRMFNVVTLTGHAHLCDAERR